MKQHMNSMVAFLFGVVIASLIGAVILLKFNAEWLTLLVMAIVPAVAVRRSGVADRWPLAKIGIYCAIGYFLGRGFEPSVSQSGASRVERHLRMPLLGHYWHIHGSIVSSLLGGVGVCFTVKQMNGKAIAKNTTEM